MTVADVSTRARYPTRCAAQSGFLDRRDPVVWPGFEAGPATSEDLAAHEAKGFHTVEGLLSPAEVQTTGRSCNASRRTPRCARTSAR